MGKRSWFDLPMGSVPWQGGAGAGGWRRNGRKVGCVDQGDLFAQEPHGWSSDDDSGTAASERAGVTASIGARKGL